MRNRSPQFARKMSIFSQTQMFKFHIIRLYFLYGGSNHCLGLSEFENECSTTYKKNRRYSKD